MKKRTKHNFDTAIIIALGSNLRGAYASSAALLDAALAHLPKIGVTVAARSAWWRSAAWPHATDPDYRNGVALVETALQPRALMAALLSAETAFGRRRDAPNGPRTLDLDLIAYGRQTIAEDGVILPHPRAADRRFVMGPLAQIAPTWTHPISGATAAALAESATVGRDAAPLAVGT